MFINIAITLYMIYSSKIIDPKFDKKGSIQIVLLWSGTIGFFVAFGAAIEKYFELMLFGGSENISILSVAICLIGSFLVGELLAKGMFLDIPIIGEITSIILTAILFGGVLSVIGAFTEYATKI